jgi:putative GTP pyrophosphokinase
LCAAACFTIVKLSKYCNMKDDRIAKYIQVRDRYEYLARKIAAVISEVLEAQDINVHAITNRAKSIASLSKKIETRSSDAPIESITDLAGIRIITYVESDVELVAKVVEELFKVDTANSLNKDIELGEDKVGYRSLHYVAQINDNRAKLPEYRRFKGLKFEIQIRTILQHSWAEIEHDRNYKFSGELPSEIKRRFKLLAGMLEIADREFNNIARDIDEYSFNVKNEANRGNLDINVNSASLKSYLGEKFQEIIELGRLEPDFNSGDKLIVEELKSFGITTLKELDEIIPIDFAENVSKYDPSGNYLGLLRNVMMISDAKKYFTNSFHNNWGAFHGDEHELLSKYGIDLINLQKLLKNAQKGAIK